MRVLVRVLIDSLEFLFLIGMIGSAVVWLLTTFEDLGGLFRADTRESGISGDELESRSGAVVPPGKGSR